MKSIGSRLMVLFSILLLLISTGLGVVAYSTSAGAMITEVEKTLPDKARDGANLVKISIEATMDILDTLAADGEVTSMDWELQQPILNSTIRRLNFRHMGIATIEGKLTLNDGSIVDIGDRQYFQRIIPLILDKNSLMLNIS